jgi:hypothetical protein
VDRLGRGEEDVVRDVDDVVDRLEAHGLDPAPEPVRRGADRDVPDDEAAVPGAERFGRDLDVGDVRRRFGELRERPVRREKRLPEQGRDLAGDAELAERVRPVGVRLEVEDRVPVPLLDGLGNEADHGQPLGELLAGEAGVDIVLDPVLADSHGVPNCLRNLRSFS